MKQEKLKCKDDIFFLTLEEIRSLESGKTGWQDVEDRLRERRLEYIRLSKMTPPKTIGIELKDDTAKDSESDADGIVLKGQSASSGKYEGVARVILNPCIDAELKPDEILVAPYTDPAWTPMFLIARAAVVEVGSYLSHAGTVAREFGMPCVVDVGNCTKIIRTGMRIFVNGDTGHVRIVTGGDGV